MFFGTSTFDSVTQSSFHPPAKHRIYYAFYVLASQRTFFWQLFLHVWETLMEKLGVNVCLTSGYHVKWVIWKSKSRTRKCWLMAMTQSRSGLTTIPGIIHSSTPFQQLFVLLYPGHSSYSCCRQLYKKKQASLQILLFYFKYLLSLIVLTKLYNTQLCQHLSCSRTCLPNLNNILMPHMGV